MNSRMLSALALGVTLAWGAGTVTQMAQAAPPGEKVHANIHEGTFLSASGHDFKIKESDNKEHQYTLAADAKITDHTGKTIKLGDVKAGQKVRITTKDGDAKTVLKLECVS